MWKPREKHELFPNRRFQGIQFTAADFISPLEKNSIRISMDGRGRLYGNIRAERLWRTVKDEEVYFHDYLSVSGVRFRPTAYLQLYCRERIHEALGYRTPYEVYSGRPFNLNPRAGLPGHAP